MSASRPQPDQLLRRLEWTVIRRLDGLLQGDYRSLFRGFGLDLADLREYQFGDDVRRIDWNVTARTQVTHVREYMEDREVTAWFLLDLSPSVDFGSETVSKRKSLTEFTGVLARLLTRHGNRVGAVFFGGSVEAVVPARGGRRHVLHLLDALLRRPALKAAPATSLSELVRAGFDMIGRRSLVFVISDFISTPGWEESLALLSRRHEVLAVRLFDPMELELPDLGLLTLQCAETGQQLFADTRDKGFRRRFAQAAERREIELRAAFQRAGVDVLELSTTDDIGDSILAFANLRKQRARSAPAPAA
jgi:prepilin-type processing-associated H-X9-DG protein